MFLFFLDWIWITIGGRRQRIRISRNGTTYYQCGHSILVIYHKLWYCVRDTNVLPLSRRPTWIRVPARSLEGKTQKTINLRYTMCMSRKNHLSTEIHSNSLVLNGNRLRLVQHYQPVAHHMLCCTSKVKQIYIRVTTRLIVKVTSIILHH